MEDGGGGGGGQRQRDRDRQSETERPTERDRESPKDSKLASFVALPSKVHSPPPPPPPSPRCVLDESDSASHTVVVLKMPIPCWRLVWFSSTEQIYHFKGRNSRHSRNSNSWILRTLALSLTLKIATDPNCSQLDTQARADAASDQRSVTTGSAVPKTRRQNRSTRCEATQRRTRYSFCYGQSPFNFSCFGAMASERAPF